MLWYLGFLVGYRVSKALDVSIYLNVGDYKDTDWLEVKWYYDKN